MTLPGFTASLSFEKRIVSPVFVPSAAITNVVFLFSKRIFARGAVRPGS